MGKDWNLPARAAQWRVMRRLLLPLVLPLLLLACKTNPHTGRSQLLIYSDHEMNELGRTAYSQMTGPGSGVRVMTDPRYLGPLQEVGRAISEAANQPDYQWEFKLIDDPNTVNAWALPGGKIAFYTAIYPVLQDQAGMAIVMGHEVMHAILEHSNERMSQGTLANVAITAADLALGQSKNREVIIGALGAGAAVGVILPFSRKHETEADEQGLYLAAKAGYDPEAAIGVWERMAELAGGGAPPEFLSTHPATERRIENMRAWMPKAKDLYARAARKMPNRKLAIPPGVK
jgi:predicted Zn-dependent protease